jgi:hypothetical protein
MLSKIKGCNKIIAKEKRESLQCLENSMSNSLTIIWSSNIRLNVLNMYQITVAEIYFISIPF